jgi:hypothetical protein
MDGTGEYYAKWNKANRQTNATCSRLHVISKNWIHRGKEKVDGYQRLQVGGNEGSNSQMVQTSVR